MNVPGKKMQSLLEIKRLSVSFPAENGRLRAVDDVSLTVGAGETVCIVGESGSGKSVTSLSILRLFERESGMLHAGEVLFHDEDLMKKSQPEMRRIRGSQIAMIFQEPMTALNPLMTIGDQICEAIRLHRRTKRAQAWTQVIAMLRAVGMSEPEMRARQYPHEFSGGMRQRAMIAMALACNPQLLIADEPTTALDVTIQQQILELLRELKATYHMAILLITHDMGVAAEIADRVVVMYAGKVMEEGTAQALFTTPRHPYTIGLMASIPGLEGERRTRLHTIGGSIPRLDHLPSGCRFHPRCTFATDRCRREDPPLRQIGQISVACWHAERVAEMRAATNNEIVQAVEDDGKELSL
jgi:oligopeptide/dipeptide ABC transporter ATP-binding protein